MINWKELCLILSVLMLLVMLLVWYIYYLCSQQGRYLRHLTIVSERITILILKIKNLIQNIWVEFKRSMAEYLSVVYKLVLLALAKSLTGDADIWKVYWMASFAMFAICCYCVKVSVEKKRAQLAQSQCVTPRNSENVWFLTPTNCLEFLFPLFYLGLAFAYFMELNSKNHPMENYWKTHAYATKIGIDVLTFLIPVISINEIRKTAQQMDSGNQSVEDADPPGVPVHIDDVESRQYSQMRSTRSGTTNGC